MQQHTFRLTVGLNEGTESIEEPAVATGGARKRNYSCGSASLANLLSFFLFCSFRQKMTCTGQAPCETSPRSVTTTLVVYLDEAGEPVFASNVT